MNSICYIIVLLLFIVYALADPVPTGGANCTTNENCGNVFGSGVGCVLQENGSKICVCPSDRAKPDCSYERKSKALCAGLNAIMFAGLPGIGNIVCNRTGPGVAQLVMALFFIVGAILICCSVCCFSDEDLFEICYLVIKLLCALLALAAYIWCFVDLINFAIGKLSDGNGFALD